MYVCVSKLNANGTITVTSTQTCGEEPEADGTTSSTLTKDGFHLVTCNRISRNITINNILTSETDTVFSLGKITKVYRIPNTDLLVFYGYDDITVYIYDFELHQIVTQFIIGSCTQVIASPSGDYLYIYGDAPPSGNLYKISLTTSPPTIQGSVSVAYIPFEWNVLMWGESSNSHYSKLSISPDGRYMIFHIDDDLAGSFIHVVDVEQMAIVKTFTGLSTNVVAYAFSTDSKRACILTYDKSMIILELNGTSTSIKTNLMLPQIGMAVVYQPFEEMFYVMYVHDQILKVNPDDGAIVGNIWTNNSFSWELYLDNANHPVICQNMSIWKDGVTYGLPNATLSSSFDPEWNAILVNIPGPDKIYILGNLFVDTKPLGECEHVIRCFPNPATETVNLQLPEGADHIEIFDNQGRLITSKNNITQNYQLNVRNFSNGLYLIKSNLGNRLLTGQLLIAR